MVCGLEQGGQAGDLAVRILNGVPAGSIPVLRSGDKALFDYAALRESGLDPAALPAGTEFVNEPPDFISAHRTELVSGMALLVAVLLFYIAALHYRKLTQRKLEVMFSSLPQRILVVDTAGNVLYSHVPDNREPSMPTRFRKSANCRSRSGMFSFPLWMRRSAAAGRSRSITSFRTAAVMPNSSRCRRAIRSAPGWSW